MFFAYLQLPLVIEYHKPLWYFAKLFMLSRWYCPFPLLTQCKPKKFTDRDRAVRCGGEEKGLQRSHVPTACEFQGVYILSSGSTSWLAHGTTRAPKTLARESMHVAQRLLELWSIVGHLLQGCVQYSIQPTWLSAKLLTFWSPTGESFEFTKVPGRSLHSSWVCSMWSILFQNLPTAGLLGLTT